MRNKYYNELIHYVSGDYLDTLTTEEMKKLYEELCFYDDERDYDGITITVRKAEV